MVLDELTQAQVRANAFTWLDAKLLEKPWVSYWDLVSGFPSLAGVIPLIGQGGIWNPRQLSHTLSITSTRKGIYEDAWLSDEMFEYAYQGKQGALGTNSKLSRAFVDKVPLIFFKQLRKGMYLPYFPAFVVADDPDRRVFTISLRQTDLSLGLGDVGIEIEKEYRERVAKQRIHQPRFRAEVLLAYDQSCAICRLRHIELLDAAHIIPDAAVSGIASVTNGLALCKIHHAAYDADVMGISPDSVVHVRPDVLQEVDGPMLRLGIQAMNGERLSSPRDKRLRPNRDFLELRFEKFRSSWV